MPTDNPRINITFEPQWQALLAELAAEEGKSLSAIAKELVLEALERREDLALSRLATARDKKSTKRIGHDAAWR